MTKDNGKLTVGEQAIQDGTICAQCMKHFPGDHPVMIPLQTEKVRIAGAPQKTEMFMLVACRNPKSPNFNHLLTLEGSCSEFVTVPDKVEVPNKIADRMKDTGT